MHTYEDFNRCVIKVAPEGSMQGFQIPYIGGFINMEPCTLWGKFLLIEREKYAFSGPQARACMGQQPGALSSKEPCNRCWQQTLAQRQYSNVASEWMIPRGSPSTRWPSLKTRCFQQLGRRRTEPHPEDKGGFLHRSCKG